MIQLFRPVNRAVLCSALCLTLILIGIPAVALAQQVQTAVVATVAPDFSVGAHSVIAVDPVGGPRQAQNKLDPPTISDITITAHENHFYRIEKFMRNNIAKFDIAAPETVIWQFSTLDAGEIDSNPYDLIFVNSQKAYLLRYGSATAWIVNPSVSADGQSEFKIGELDLSAYDGGAGVPHMTSGVIAAGKLFVAMQRLDSFWVPANDAYVAVFDVATDEEIDTQTPNDDGLKGIRLPIRNTGAIQYLAVNDTIYVQGVGNYFDADQVSFPSGIVSIDPGDYSVETVLLGGDPYGNISGMSIVSPDKGYFVGYAGWGINTLYPFNPATGEVFEQTNAELKNINIAGMQSGTAVDQNGMLWVSDQTNARLVILDTVTDEIDEFIATELNPTQVAFTSEGTPGTGSGSSSSSGGCFINSSSGSVSFWK
jgi:hypothetical protein